MSKIDDEIYESLTNGDDLLSGLYAYSVYKEEKNKRVEEIKKSNGGKNPTEKELSRFYSTAKSSIIEYREKGKNFGEAALFKRYQTEIEKEKLTCYENTQKQLTKALDDYKKPFWKDFGPAFVSSLFGSIGFAAFPFLLLFGSFLYDADFTKDFLHHRFNYLNETTNKKGDSSPNTLDDKTAPFQSVDTIPETKTQQSKKSSSD